MCLLYSDVTYESGVLSEFVGGQSPGTSYENWVSHVTEGIASEGFNDYGPDWLDIQTNGFGSYRKLEEGSPTLVYWETIFTQFIAGDTTTVDSLLQDSIESFFYELVIFEDTTVNKTFHILREQLDTSFVDLNQPDNDADDVIGSFRNSWGLYIINPAALREQIMIQVPHPCDDFIAPYIALDIYQQTDGFGFMINGAGREVEWSEVGEYSNSKSHSDPSRYAPTVFQTFQEVVTQPLIGLNPHWPLVFAIHSFDNASHAPRKSVIIAAGAQNSFTTKPIRDITDDHFDIINFTEEFPISQNQFNNPDPLHVTDYYEVFYDDQCVYDNGAEQFPMTLATELKGPSVGIQMLDLQSQVSGWSVYEPWVHVELDEKPMIFDSTGITDDTVYTNGLYPTGIQNFSMIREYYQPFIEALDLYLTHWETVPDQTSPDSIAFIMAYNVDNSDQVYLNWSPVYDTNFKSFQIQADTDTLTDNSMVFDLTDYTMLQYMRRDHQTLSGLNNTEPWLFRIRAVDYFENAGPWSETVSNMLPGHSPPDTILYFDNNNSIQGIIDEDIDGESYEIDTLVLMPGNSPTLALFGNTWKSVQIDPFTPDTATVLQVFARIDSISEIQAIGFSTGENTIRYSFSGHEALDIEEWIPVYQGTNQVGSWQSYRIPLGDDWLAWYDSLSSITEIHFINDQDDTSRAPGSIHFSMIRDYTTDLPIPPVVSIDYSIGNIRYENHQELVSVSFSSSIQDTDSYSFSYYWEFGDGESSTEPDPSHDYLVEDDHDYTVILTVEDETGQQGWATTAIQVDQGSSSFPLTINFVGDIMMGRSYEEDDGIITTQGVQALYQPTYEILGLLADVTVANLEIPLSNQGFPHPTKGIVFRCAPENVAGLIYGGIDVVSLANNHILDYMEPAMIQTQNILDEAGILHSGAGMNSYEAYLPAFKSVKGQTIAFLASSDRTGQYNNYQPYLNAGENKPGFAYMTPYYLKQQIQSVEDLADLVVVEMHAGSEYSYSPGAHYDSYSPPDGFETLRTNPASEIGFTAVPKYGLEAEDYSWRLDRPQMWDRAIRQFAVDEGADAVIVHHPHIIQGVEIYNGKMIAHSLGNFIFDLNYAETYTSMILNAEADESGFIGYTITPLYIDDYLTLPATGELGNYILDYIAMRSRELDTYVHVNQETHRAQVIMDSTTIITQELEYSIWDPLWKEIEFEGDAYFISNPLQIPDAGSIASIVGGFNHITHYRLGRERIWMKNFENEGSSLWNFNSDDEFLQDSIFRRGGIAASHLRNADSQDNIVTNLEDRMPFKSELEHTIHGYIKTQNGKDVTLQLRLAEGRTGENLLTISMADSVYGTQDWMPYWFDIQQEDSANFFNLRMNTGIPDSGQSQTWFDDVGLVQWDSILTFDNFPVNIVQPNDYNYIQVFSSQVPGAMAGIQLVNSLIGDLHPLTAVPRTTNSVITVPGKCYFFDESQGPVGNWFWVFGNGYTSSERHPTIQYFEPGIYEVSLTVTGVDGETDTAYLTVIALANDSQEHDLGDVNGDGSITMVDALLCSNYILGLFELQPEEFLAADVDGNGTIDIFDVLLIADLAD